MIYTSVDYLNKYFDALGEVIALAELDGYSFEYIQNIIADSKVVHEFENSNITTIAFSSSNAIYHQLFPNGKASINDIKLFSPCYWIGEAYVRIFLRYKMTFEAIFAYLPISLMYEQYHLYHEMDFNQLYEYFESLLKTNVISKFMEIKKMNNSKLSELTNISVETIKAIKSGRRDINKLQSNYLESISNALGIRMRSLIRPISLDIVEPNY